MELKDLPVIKLEELLAMELDKLLAMELEELQPMEHDILFLLYFFLFSLTHRLNHL